MRDNKAADWEISGPRSDAENDVRLRLDEGGRSGRRNRRRCLLHLGLEFAAHLGRGLCKDAVMNGEEREFETVADAGLVVDRSQVVLDHLLGGFEPKCDFAILAALD